MSIKQDVRVYLFPKFFFSTATRNKHTDASREVVIVRPWIFATCIIAMSATKLMSIANCQLSRAVTSLSVVKAITCQEILDVIVHNCDKYCPAVRMQRCMGY